MKNIYRDMAFVVSTLTFLTVNLCQAEIVEESGSLLEFFAGHEENCAYDNWVSHISEGIIREGYNDYGPVELDRQTNGFGDYQIVDSLQNPNGILRDWSLIFANILSGNVEEASAILDSSAFAESFELVLLEDQDEHYVIVREVLDNGYFDDNGTEDESDDVRGSFSYGWGLYIFNPNAKTPEAIIEVPHPCDDFIAPFIGIDAFISMGASAMFVAGAGREVKWTQVGVYDNSKSRSDPTRTINRTIFQEAHKAIVDSIANEFVLPIHSYDSGGRDLAQCLISTFPDNYPDRPVIDRINNFDILHLTPLYPVAANSIGNADHDAVRIDDFYAFWNNGDSIYYNYEIPISNNMPGLNGWPSPQRNYSYDHRDTLNNVENYMHIEHDEFPNVITEEILGFYPAGGVPTYVTYVNAVEFYRPLYASIYSYYHLPRFHTVPDDFDGIQTAIDGSYGGDTILVHPGEYTESINYLHKNLLISSLFLPTNDARYIDSTIIIGEQNGSVITFVGNESESAKLVGFTIRGSRTLDGAGIFMTDASPTIDHCIITGNIATGFGGGMFCDNSQPIIINCTITGNSAAQGGGALSGYQSRFAVTNSILTGNEPQEIYFLRFGMSNQIVCAWSDIEGGALEIVTSNNGEVIWADGNIVENPLFIDPENANFHLSPFSPCVNAGSPESPLDPDSTRADMGAIPIQFRNIVAVPDIIEFTDLQTGATDSLSLTIHNVGIDTISILSWRITPDNTPFSINGNDGDFVLEPDSELTVWILFAPQDQNEYQAILTIESDEPGEEIIEVILRGSALGVGDDEKVKLTGYQLLTVYPNPFNSRFSIGFHLEQDQAISIILYDPAGREVINRPLGNYAGGYNTLSLNGSALPTGAYYLRFQTRDYCKVIPVRQLK